MKKGAKVADSDQHEVNGRHFTAANGNFLFGSGRVYTEQWGEDILPTGHHYRL